MHTPKKGLADMAAGGWWQSHEGCVCASLEQSKKFENASKKAQHLSIFVPLMGAQILLEESVHQIVYFAFITHIQLYRGHSVTARAINWWQHLGSPGLFFATRSQYIRRVQK